MAVQETAVSGSGVQGQPGTTPAISTGQTANPAQVSPEEQRKIAVKASIDDALGKVNSGLEFSQKGVLVGNSIGRLSQLVRALQADPNASVEILPSALGNDGDQKTRLENVRKYLSSQGEAAKRIKLPNLTEESKPQDPANTSNSPSQEPPITETIKVNRNISSIGLYESEIQKVEIPSAAEQPPITVLHRGGNQTFAHIVVSEVDPTGKVTTTIAKVEQGTDLTKPIPGADIWTKPKDGTGTLTEGAGIVTLTEDQRKAVAEILKNLKQKPTPKPAEPEKPADEAGKPEKGRTSGKDDKPAEGSPSGDGQQTPPPTDKGTPAPLNRAQISALIKRDGKLSPEESKAFLAMLREGDAMSRLRQEYGSNAVKTVGRHLEIEVEPDSKIQIDWSTGEASVAGKKAPSPEQIIDFKILARSIITGSFLPDQGMPRRLPKATDFSVTDGFSDKEKRALAKALSYETSSNSFVKALAGELGFSMRRDGTNTIHLSEPRQGAKLAGISILSFNRETGEIQLTRERAGVGIQDELALGIIKQAIRKTIKELD